VSNFEVWLNRISVENGKISAVVELRSINISEVATGGREFVQGICSVLDLPVTVDKWSVSPFRSSYYSEYPESADLDDRYPIFWRIYLTGRGVENSINTGPSVSPVEYDGYDSSWSPLCETSKGPCAYIAIGVRLGSNPPVNEWDRLIEATPHLTSEIIECSSGRAAGAKLILGLDSEGGESLQNDARFLDEQMRNLGIVNSWVELRTRLLKFAKNDRR
jgi:hypothetical protein